MVKNSHYVKIDSPLGPLLLVADDRGLRRIDFANGKHTRRNGEESASGSETALDHETNGNLVLNKVVRQLRAYFAGELEDFDLPLAPEGTAFQQKVWDELLTIPYGETISYGELARRVGNPNASRAVGLANGSNPIPIIIPCHRVIGSNGKLTGYGGGLPIKEKLLALEKKQLRLL
jgi:methylated-DNA-[protein]-cysteine S-methyltransferase